MFEKNFNYLFQHFNSDKGKLYRNQYQKPIKRSNELISGHEYHNYYENFLKKKKDNKITILELGSFHGNSTAAFFFYFKYSQIYAGDIFPDLFRYHSNKINNFFVDTSSEESIQKNILSKKIFYDLIIEDAGHFFKDQIISVFLLFRILKEKGIFVVEELDFPNIRKDMNIKNERPSLKEILKLVKADKEFNSSYVSKEDKEYFINNVSNISIFKGRFNEIAFIEKK